MVHLIGGTDISAIAAREAGQVCSWHFQLLKWEVIIPLNKTRKMCNSPKMERGSNADGQKYGAPSLLPLPYTSMTLLHFFIRKPDSPPASPSAWEEAGIIYQK